LEKKSGIIIKMKDFKFFWKDVGCTEVSIGDGKVEIFFLPNKKKLSSS